MKITVVFDNLGPYHIARLSALEKQCDLTAIEVRAQSMDYEWKPSHNLPFKRITLNSSNSEELCAALDQSTPDVLFLPGWSSPAALIAISWARRKDVPGIVMSASQKIDYPRRPWREWIKRQILSSFSGALVGGEAQRDYVHSLGMPKERLISGYNSICNTHFELGSDKARANAAGLRSQLGLPNCFLLASCRFIPKKNLLRLLDAFAAARLENDRDWSLVILGDGVLRPEIELRISALGLDEVILLPGFQQYDNLPPWFGLASGFILCSTSEQWGLVVNEAMASALPVLVSEKCGCARDLVITGKTGFTFSPESTTEMSEKISKLMAMSEDRRNRLGAQGRHHIDSYSPNVFAKNAVTLAHKVIYEKKLTKVKFTGRLVLPILTQIAARRGQI